LVAAPGTTNSGGGGGGSYSAGQPGGGGSGIVILRYREIYRPATNVTGNPSYTIAGGYRIYQWTTSGTIRF